jgi:hypothetical protein
MTPNPPRLAQDALRRYREIPDEIKLLKEEQTILADLLRAYGIPTGNAVYRDVAPRTSEKYAGIIEVLAAAGRPLTTQEVFLARPDHLGYKNTSGIRPALEALSYQGRVRACGKRGSQNLWASATEVPPATSPRRNGAGRDAIREVLAGAPRELTAREIFDSRPDHLGYPHSGTIQKALERMEGQGEVVRKKEGRRVYWSEAK